MSNRTKQNHKNVEGLWRADRSSDDKKFSSMPISLNIEDWLRVEKYYVMALAGKLFRIQTPAL